MKAPRPAIGRALLFSSLLGCGAAFGQSDTSSTHAVVISPGNTNFLNPDHIRPVAPPDNTPTGSSGTSTNSAPVAPVSFVPPNPLPAHPHWTWDLQNHEFTNVVVTKVEADMVTIKCDTGATMIDISLLAPDIQKQLNYDPELAAKASADRDAARDAAAAKSAPPAGN